jgi:hypothetical protein
MPSALPTSHANPCAVLKIGPAWSHSSRTNPPSPLSTQQQVSPPPSLAKGVNPSPLPLRQTPDCNGSICNPQPAERRTWRVPPAWAGSRGRAEGRPRAGVAGWGAPAERAAGRAAGGCTAAGRRSGPVLLAPRSPSAPPPGEGSASAGRAARGLRGRACRRQTQGGRRPGFGPPPPEIGAFAPGLCGDSISSKRHPSSCAPQARPQISLSAPPLLAGPCGR